MSLSGCALFQPRPAGLVVAMDEAFAEARPALASALARLRVTGFESRYLRIGLGESPAIAIDAVQRLARDHRPAILVASPLLASALFAGTEDAAAGPSSLGAIPLIALDWARPPARNLILIETDALSAYHAAGRACGEYISAIKRSSGGDPACGLVFAPSGSRPSSELEAFAQAYGAASGGAPLLIRTLGSGRSPQDAQADAQAAVQKLLASDLRVLFAAAGGSTLAALGAAAYPDLVLGAELPASAALPELAFRISPDDEALARAVAAAAERRLRPSGPPNSPEEAPEAPILVPARLIEGPAGGRHEAGGRSFASFMVDSRLNGF